MAALAAAARAAARRTAGTLRAQQLYSVAPRAPATPGAVAPPLQACPRGSPHPASHGVVAGNGAVACSSFQSVAIRRYAGVAGSHHLGTARGMLAAARLLPTWAPARRLSGLGAVAAASSGGGGGGVALRGSLLPPAAAGPRRPLLGPAGLQARGAGRAGGFKRKKKACRPRTVHQKGLGKRMEFYWPRHDSHRTRVPLYENSRRHVIFDHSKRRWMVMWYRNGIQVFRTWRAKKGSFEQGRAHAILFFKQLQQAGKLGRPKPDQCRSGVRGVFFDKEERAWVARWSDSGMKKYAVYGTQEMGFAEAYKAAVHTRVQSVRQNHQFFFQRTRWKGQRRPLGQAQT